MDVIFESNVLKVLLSFFFLFFLFFPVILTFNIDYHI